MLEKNIIFPCVDLECSGKVTMPVSCYFAENNEVTGYNIQLNENKGKCDKCGKEIIAKSEFVFVVFSRKKTSENL